MKKLLVLVALAATLVPAIFVLREAGGLAKWQGVLPGGTTDSRYYYARIREVADGHPFNGNPYAYEHRETLSPAFFLPDIATALPVLMGIPFDIAMAVNIFFWSALFLLLAFSLLRSMSIGKRWAVLWAVLAYAASYSFMLRPTVMQVVYPAFLVFLIALFQFLREPSRRRALWLAAASALAFYVYTYLAYVVILTLGVVLVWYLFARRFAELRTLVLSGLISALLLLPFGFYALLSMRNPLYLETLRRLGLVYTRIPTIETYYYGRWIFVAIAIFSLLWIWNGRKEERAGTVLWIASGAGLLGALFLNVVTGVDLALGVHIGRLSLPWVPLALGAGVYELYRARTGMWEVVRPTSDVGRTTSRNGRNRTFVLFMGVLCIILALGTAASVRRGLDFFGFTARGQTVAELQAYAAPLAWLEENVPEESVIWSDDALAQHIPILTRHYPLFHESVLLHTLSNAEVEERYLLSRSLAPLTVGDLRRESSKYLGAGGKQRPRDNAYFTELAERSAAVRNNPEVLLAQYHVAYLLYDRTQDVWQNLPLRRAVYDDGRFAVIPLPL